MSKNLRGYSGMQPIINLVDITASSITATNGTFTNLSIGTYSITTLNVSNLVATGTVILSGLTQQNPLNTDDHNILIHDPTTNRLYKFNSLYFSPINDRLHVPKLTVNSGLTLNADAEINSNHDFYFREILPAVGGDKGVIFWENIARIIGRRTATGLPELQLVNNTARQNGIDYQISLQDTSTQLNTTSTINFRVNNAIKMTIDNSNITFSNIDLIARDISANDVTVTGTLNAANITFNSANIPGGLTVGGLTDLNGDLEVFGSVTLTQITAAPSSGPAINMLMWNSATGRISGDDSIKYDASTDILTLPRILATTSGNIYDLTVSNEFIQTVRLSDTTSDLNFNIQFINASNRLRESNGLKYNPLNNKLYVTNINSTDVTITGEIIQSNAQLDITSTSDFKIPFLNSSNQLRYSNGLVYNPAFERLTLTTLNVTNFTPTNLTVSNDLTVNGDTILSGDTTITAKTQAFQPSENSRIPFIEGNGQTTGILCHNGNFYFNPSSGLVNATVFTSDEVRSPTLILSTNSILHDSTYGLLQNSSIGHLFRISGTWKLKIDNDVNVYEDLQIQPKQNVENNLIFLEDSVTASGNKSKLQFSSIGVIQSRRDSGNSPQLDFRNNSVTNFQIRLNETSTYYNVPTGGIHRWYDNASTNLMQVNSSLFSINVPTNVNGLLEASQLQAGATVVTTKQLYITGEAHITSDTVLGGDTTITAFNSTVSNNNRIPFIEGGGATGRLCESNLYYNPSNQTLVSSTVLGTTAINSPTFTITGTNNGQVSINPTYGMFFIHSDGYVFRIGSNWKLRIGDTTTTIYNNLQVQDDNNIRLNETDPAITGTKNEIIFNNIGRIESKRDASLNTQLNFFNESAYPSVQYQIQLNSDSNKYNVVSNGTHNFYIDTFSKFEITTNEVIIKETLRLDDVTLPTADVNFYILLQNSGNNQVKRSNLVYNPVSEILTINKIQLEGLDVATATDNKLLFLDPNDEVEKSNNDLTYDATTSTLKFKILDNASANSKITVQKPLHYGSGAFAQPLNYTIRIGHTDLINTIDVLGSGLNTGKYGNGIYLSILRSGVKTTTYGQNSLIWNWNAYVNATNTATTFNMNGLPGLWDIMVTFKFEWDAGNTNRANPIIKAEVNGTLEEEGVESQYVRQQLGRVITVKYHNKLYLNTLDTIAFRTFLNIGATTNYSSLATASQFDLTDFMFMATYLGPLDEYDLTPT